MSFLNYIERKIKKKQRGEIVHKIMACALNVAALAFDLCSISVPSMGPQAPQGIISEHRTKNSP